MLVKLKQHLIMFALTREIQQNINFLCRVIFGHEWVNQVSVRPMQSNL